MITLYSFGPSHGLPDFSPFVMKAELLLKMSGLPFRTDTSGFRKAPKGKLPYIDDDGELVADSDLPPLAPRDAGSISTAVSRPSRRRSPGLSRR